MDRRAGTLRAVRVVRAVRTSVAVVAALAMLALQPVPARADTHANTFFPAHWGPNTYISVPPENVFYRSVGLLDNTNDPALSEHIRTFADVMNFLHIYVNQNYPVLHYIKDAYFVAGQPCAQAPVQYLVVCKDEAASATAPGTAAITRGGLDHIFHAIVRFRPSVVDPWCSGDKFTLVVQLLSNALGLDQNLSNPASAMHPTIPVGRCTRNGWVLADYQRMAQAYSHAVG